MPYGPSSVVGEVLRDQRAAVVVRMDDDPVRVQLWQGTLHQVTTFMTGIRSDSAARGALFAELGPCGASPC